MSYVYETCMFTHIDMFSHVYLYAILALEYFGAHNRTQF